MIMETITIKAIHEGKVSKYNKNLDGTESDPFTTICYPFENCPNPIPSTNSSDFILLHIPLKAIVSKVPTSETLTFKNKQGKPFPFVVFNIKLNKGFDFSIVRVKKASGEYSSKSGNLAIEASNFTEGFLRDQLSAVADDETVNSTDSRPPCN